MRITPRKDEVQQVVDILESDKYKSGDDMAKALIKAIGDILAMRDWVALTHRFSAGQLGINWGPFGSEIEARAAAEKIALNGSFATVKLYSPGTLLANVTSSKRKGWCQTAGCGHADWVHLVNGNSRAKCGLETCPCSQFTK
ncbi:hypothetical protein [Actinoplanes sp. NPDC026670]|uniref:hypothetical protein n=1 Tax=Actinoplanes sp. NPDC026670 TaxID=3154700 RepID=UPI0033C2DD67